jgi:hypothetical protein
MTPGSAASCRIAFVASDVCELPPKIMAQAKVQSASPKRQLTQRNLIVSDADKIACSRLKVFVRAWITGAKPRLRR